MVAEITQEELICLIKKMKENQVLSIHFEKSEEEVRDKAKEEECRI